MRWRRWIGSWGSWWGGLRRGESGVEGMGRVQELVVEILSLSSKVRLTHIGFGGGGGYSDGEDNVA